MEQAKHEKLTKIIRQVLLNYEVQQRWQQNVDPDFIDCVEQMIKRYDQNKPKEQWMRTGVMLGAVYEQWRQHQESSHG
jgi:tRNA uridine 5-carbamoylmethylation protein Kti12